MLTTATIIKNYCDANPLVTTATIQSAAIIPPPTANVRAAGIATTATPCRRRRFRHSAATLPICRSA